MIWYFLAGMVAGATGMVMYAHHWVHKHATVIRMPLDDRKEKSDD